MSTPVLQVLDMGGARRIVNLAAAIAAGQPVTFEQMNAAIEGIAWKDSVRVASVANVTIATPGATIDGVTMVTNGRVLLKNRSSQPESGLYIWNGAAVPMTRALDGSTFDELESAIVPVEEGTNAGTQWRQTQVNGSIGVANVIFTSFLSSAPAATESSAGIAEIATQSEVNSGSDDLRFITALKLFNWTGKPLKHYATIGDASATSIPVTHNFNTRDVQVYVYEAAGSYREVFVEKQHTTVNQVTLIFDTAPALNSLRVVVFG